MKRLTLARTALAVIGVVLWGYGYRTGNAQLRLVAIVVLALTLLLRYLPARWFDGGRPS
jgi:type IV secretory pathway VirB2 component (pilin)